MRPGLVCLTTVLLLAATTVCEAATGPVGNCKCVRTSNTFLPISRIKNYSLQKAGLCHINAVVFTTVRGITVCADPKKKWVTTAMTSVDARTQTSSVTVVPPKTTASKPTLNTAGASWPQHCCLKTSDRKFPLNRVVSYTVQTTGLCPVNAIVFRTVKSRTVCSNPDLDWVHQAMKKVDSPNDRPKKSKVGKRKKQRKRQNKHKSVV